MDSLKPYLNKVDTSLSKCQYLVDFEKKTQIPKVYTVASLVLLAVTSLVTQVLANFTFTLVSLVYPTYKVVEAVVKSDAASLKFFSTYFVLLSGFQVVEIGGFLADLIPFYHLLKTLFVLWLYVPQFFGIKLLTDLVVTKVSPFFKTTAESKKE